MTTDLTPYMSRLSDAKDAFVAQLENCSREERSKAPGEGWNMLQVMEHLITSEKGTLEYLKRKTMAPFNDIPVAGVENASNSDQLIEALKSDRKWKAPEVLPEPTGTQSFENMLAYWDRLREDYQEFLGQLNPGYYEREIFKHPFTGRLNIYQTLDFLINHIVHHDHQISRLRAQKKEE